MPDVSPCEYVLRVFNEIGPTAPGPAGPAPISFSEIAAWCSLTGVRLTSWQARTLRQLSRDYIAEHYAAEDPKRPAPWESPEETSVEAVALDLRASLAAMAAE